MLVQNHQDNTHTHSKEDALISHSVPEYIIIGSMVVWCYKNTRYLTNEFIKLKKLGL